MLIKEMRSEDKPRERFQISPRLASNTDLVAILLRTGRQGHSVMEIAKEVVDLLERETGINGLAGSHGHQGHRTGQGCHYLRCGRTGTPAFSYLR